MEQNNKITIPVIAGMRGDLEPHTAPPGTITLARNVRFTAPGVVQSRRGMAAISSASVSDVAYSVMLDTTQGPDFLHPSPGGFYFGAKGYAYRFDSVANVCFSAGSYSTAQPRGRLDVSAREELLPSLSSRLTPWPLSCAVGSGFVVTCHAVGNAQPVDAAVAVGNQRDPIDYAATAGAVIRTFTEDGALVASSYFEDAASAMVIRDDSTDLVMIVSQDDTGNLYVREVSSTGVIDNITAIGSMPTGQYYYAACEWPGVGWALIYQSSATVITIQKMAGLVAVGAAVTVTIASGASAPVSIYADATHLYAGWALRGGASYDTQARVYDTTMALTSGGTVSLFSAGAATIASGPPLFGSCSTSGRSLVLVCLRGTDPGMRSFEITAAGALLTGADNYNVMPLSAPFDNGMFWASITVESQGGYASLRSVLLDLQEDRTNTGDSAFRLKYPKIGLVCDGFVLVEGDEPPANRYLQHMHIPAQLTSGEWVMGVPRLVRSDLGSDDDTYLVLCEFLKFATGAEQQVRTCRDDVVVTGSLTSLSYGLGSYQFDSSGGTLAAPSQGIDLGMLVQPGFDAIGGTNTTDGAMTPSGEYQYRAVTELIDARGRRWRSPPSNIGTVTLGAGDDAASLTVKTWLPLLRAFYELPSNSRICVHIYRTTDGGSTFQRTTPAQGVPIPYLTGSVAYTDENSDTLLSFREFLYTDGGVLQNDHPPSCRFITATEDRVWIAGLWDETLAQSSKLLVPGEPVQFSDLDSFKVAIPEAITGIAAQDGIVFLFAKSAVYTVQGLGPNDQGQGAWDTPRCITRSSGCIDWRSIVETSMGVFYQSERGIMLLPRGAGEPNFIGAPVEDLLESFSSTITGSAVCQTSDGNTVRFCTSGGTLIFDLETLAWSYDTPPASPANTVHTKVCDADAGPTYARKVLTSTNGFDQEQTALTTDAGTAIASRVEWAPVHPSGLAGWCTFTGAISSFGKLDGANYPANAVQIYCNVDNDTTGTATLASMASMADIDYRRLVVTKRQGSAATLAIATSGAPWRFIGWTIELEDLRGSRNVAAPLETY